MKRKLRLKKGMGMKRKEVSQVPSSPSLSSYVWLSSQASLSISAAREAVAVVSKISELK